MCLLGAVGRCCAGSQASTSQERDNLLTEARPTGCRLAAPPPIEWYSVCVILTLKIAPISRPRSGVGYSGGLGGLAGCALDGPRRPTYCPNGQACRATRHAITMRGICQYD